MRLFAWSRDLLSGSLVAAITLAYGFSFAALLFPGPLAAGVPAGVAMMLFGAGLVGLWLAWRSSLPLAIAGPDTPVMTAIAALSTGIVLPLVEGGLPAEAGIAMAGGLVLLVTALVGLCLLVLGLARVGSALRFIPHPVIGGFLAGSGLALCQGAATLLLGGPPSAASLGAMLAPEQLPRLLAALAIPAVLLALRPFWRPFYLLPLLFFVELALIHLAIAGGAIDPAASGWFLPGLAAGGEGGLRPLWALAADGAVWSALLRHLPEIAAVALIASTSVLMNVSGLEVLWRRSAQLDRELVDHGLVGVVGGLAGGAHSCLSLSRSLLNREAGGRTRVSAVVAALLVLACGLLGSGLVSLLPVPLLAGLLLYVGLSLLLDRLVELPPRQSASDYLLMVVIVGVIAVYGFLAGVVAGIIGACLLFAFSYSRIGIVKHILNRCERASDVERPPPQKRLLEQHGERIRVIALRGYIFFGTSNGLLDRVRADQGVLPAEGPRLLILDFQSVTGMDSSAQVSFLKLAHFCEEQGLELLFSGAPPAIQRLLGGQEPALARVRRFAAQEEALEYAEEVVLAWTGGGLAGSLSPERWLQRDSGLQDPIKPLLAILESRTVEAGTVIFRQGEPSDSIELLVSGRVQVLLELPDGSRIRLRSMLEQTVLGEMGFFRELPRSATVIADQPSRLLRVTRDSYGRMLVEAPEAAAVLHRMIITTLADRLAFANNEVVALKR